MHRKTTVAKSEGVENTDAATQDDTVNVEPATPQPPTEDDIAALAYELWVERGCPIGSPDEDWLRAEETIRNRRVKRATA